MSYTVNLLFVSLYLQMILKLFYFKNLNYFNFFIGCLKKERILIKLKAQLKWGAYLLKNKKLLLKFRAT